MNRVLLDVASFSDRAMASFSEVEKKLPIAAVSSCNEKGSPNFPSTHTITFVAKEKIRLVLWSF